MNAAVKVAFAAVGAAVTFAAPESFAAKKEVKFREFPHLPELLRCENGARVPLESNYGWSMQSWERIRRPEIVKFFTVNEFGVRPVERPANLTFKATRRPVMGGKAEKWNVRIDYSGPYGRSGFSMVGYRPVSSEPVSPIVALFAEKPDSLFDAEHPEKENEMWPVAKMLVRGYAVFALDVNEIAADSPECFKTGVFKCFDKPGSRTPFSWGALSAWAWGASRVMDWLVTEPAFDSLHVVVGGLGARGTAALWAGVTDERIRMVALKNSGCGGAKLNNAFTPGAEQIEDSVRTRGHQFCGNWAKWADRDRQMPYDQHELMAAMVPRFVKVGTDAGDPTIGAEAEFDCCVAASPIWWLFGVTGLDISTCPGNINYVNRGGHIGHHMLKGRHGLCIHDWMNLADYADWSGFRGFYKPDAKPVDVPDPLLAADGRKITTKEEWENVRRPEIIKFFGENLYGVGPQGFGRPPKLDFVQIKPDEALLEGRAVYKEIECRYGGVGGDGRFHIYAYLPKSAKPVPAFVWISISEHWFKKLPLIDELIKRGYAFIQYRAEDYAPDFPEMSPLRDDFFTRDIYARLEKPENRTGKSWGAIGAWAWGASRIMDWIESVPAFDSKHVGLVGLSRCGKTALWAGANDTRFAMVCSCGSGCSGSRLNRLDIPQREPFWLLQAVQSFWFCDNAARWAGLENFMTWDTDALGACVAPRIFVTNNGDSDNCAGPTGDFWSAYLASRVWKQIYGLDGIDPSEKFPAKSGTLVGRKDLKGAVYFNYHVGGHCVESYDWNKFMDIADAHGWRK
ncbi:MAG: hypothetical protein J6T01_01530 [Kiritimatiellae bacterium]|nr:hypothetical protein [Kiritimatiellia bacterium]